MDIDPEISAKPKRRYNYTKKTGRPKESAAKRVTKLRLNMAVLEKLYKAGLTDEDVSQTIGITQVGLHKWKEDNNFRLSLKSWKDEADEKVERSLYERACGYSHKAVKMFVIGGKVVTEQYTEHYPPDPVSCIFWLKNRKREEWRDKHEVEHNGTFNFAQMVNDIEKLAIPSKN